jgi:hypothetical protein
MVTDSNDCDDNDDCDDKVRLYYCPVLLWKKSVAIANRKFVVLVQLDEVNKSYVRFRTK